MTHLINHSCKMRREPSYILAKHLCSGQDQDLVALNIIISLCPDFAEICIVVAEEISSHGKNYRGLVSVTAKVSSEHSESHCYSEDHIECIHFKISSGYKNPFCSLNYPEENTSFIS